MTTEATERTSMSKLVRSSASGMLAVGTTLQLMPSVERTICEPTPIQHLHGYSQDRESERDGL